MTGFELKAEAISLAFESVQDNNLAVPGDEWRGCQCFMSGTMEYGLELETFVDDGSIEQDFSLRCNTCGLYLDYQEYLYAGGNIHTPEPIPVTVTWKSEMRGGPYMEQDIWGEVSARS